MVEAAAFWSGLAFMESTTVLPVLLARLHASDVVIGLARFIQTLGFTLPALLAAHYIHGRARHKSFLLTICAIGRSGILLLPPLFLLFGASRPALALIGFLAIYAIFWSFDGGCAVSWFDIIAKTIPARVRGRFFGAMQTLGGVAAIGAGFAVKYVLQHRPFPLNFALLAGGWCLGLAVSQICLALIREPRGEALDGDEKPAFAAYLRLAVPLLRNNRNLGSLVLTKLLVDGAGMAAPFYVLFGARDLHAGLRMVGVYAILQSAGKVAMGPVWGWLSDHAGPQNGLRAIAATVVAIPCLALVAAHGGVWVFPVVFVLLGAVQDGVWMVTSNALLGALDERERSLGVGVSSVMQVPSALYGLTGGLLAQAAGLPTLFAVAVGFGAAGLVVSLRARSA